MADVRAAFPGKRITASTPRVSEELYRALLLNSASTDRFTVYSSHQLPLRADEKPAFDRQQAIARQLPQLPLLRTANRILTLPVNNALQRHWYPHVAKAGKHDLFVYSGHYPWGQTPVASKEIWMALDFHVFRAHPEKWAAQLKRLRATPDRLWVLCISGDTAKDAKEYLQLPEDQIQVAHLGVDHDIFNPDAARDEELLAPITLPPGNFVLNVGAWYGRKNVITLLKAMDEINCERKHPIPLVLAGFCGTPGTHRERQAFYEAMERGITPITRTGGVTDEQMAAIYRRATMLVHPSLFEGFGLTLIEAMACGAPVICGHHSAVTEVAGGASLEVTNLLAVEELADAITSLLEDLGMAAELRGKGFQQASRFQWAGFAKEAVAFMERAANF